LVGALIASPGAVAMHRPRTQVRPVERLATLSAPGTKGWRLHVGAVLGLKPQVQQLGAQAVGHQGQSVTYNVRHAYTAPDGTIRETLPGVGRVAVRFEPKKEMKLEFTAQPGCTSDGISIERSGWFTGTIEFHGEGGYTDISRRRAYGQIMEVPREVCRNRKSGRRAGGSSADQDETVLLTAGRPEGHGQLMFDASPLGRLGSIGPTVEFDASYTHSRQGMFITANTRVRGGVKDFSLTEVAGSPSEATVAPPAPFTGSAIFSLESPKKASWTGDLGVEIPTLGIVSLAGPDFWSALCSEGACTKTLPPGRQVIFATATVD
jgi:hypothetical protein